MTSDRPDHHPYVCNRLSRHLITSVLKFAPTLSMSATTLQRNGRRHDDFIFKKNEQCSLQQQQHCATRKRETQAARNVSGDATIMARKYTYCRRAAVLVELLPYWDSRETLPGWGRLAPHSEPRVCPVQEGAIRAEEMVRGKQTW